MKSALIATLLLIATVLPATASLLSFDFIFSGAAYDDPNNAVAIGVITFEESYLLNPGRNVFDLTTPDGLAAVLSLNVTVTGASGGFGDGYFTRADFTQVIFDTSLVGMDLTRELVGQSTSSLSGCKWGGIEMIPGSDPPQSYTGDFEIFAAGGSSAPSGVWPFQLGTDNGINDGMQLTSFAPANAVPEPSTWLLTVIGLGGFGLVRKRGRDRRGQVPHSS